MSFNTVSQYYADIERVALQIPQSFAEPQMIELFNVNLAEAQKVQPTNPVLCAIKQAKGKVRMDDLFIRAGQLKAAIREEPAAPAKR
ncbi:MAG TPA: hypothetical protein VMF29_07950 [Candidatus Edwardsbacteria bacterium]|nr:hypothetical protein [Candidatus Edwardsbacteria bacterium]